MEALLKDIRLSLRLLLKNPGLSFVIVLSLAVSIGANTAIFSVINAVLFRPLPYNDPDRLAMIYTVDPGVPGIVDASDTAPWAYPTYEQLAQQQNAFEKVAAFGEQDFNLSDNGEPERVQVEMVSATYLPMLGIQAVQGRTFAPEADTTPGGQPFALIGYGLWQRRYGSSPKIIGETIHLNRIPLTIIGVLPLGFKGQSGGVEAWVPMMMAPVLTFPERLTNPNSVWHDVIARLKPGVTLDAAKAEMGVLAKQLAAANPGPPGAPELGINVVPLKAAKRDPALGKSLLILFAAVAFVLLIACINIANLLLAKAMSRQKEIAIRLALGAGRGHLIRQLLTESVVLALIGGLVGLFIAYWGVNLLTSFELASIANRPGFWAKYVKMLNFNTVRIDGIVLLFNTGISVLTGILFGLIPAIQASRPDVYPSLKEGGNLYGSKSGNLRRLSARSLLVISEVALAIVLLVGAGLMIESVSRMRAIELGFQPDNVVTMKINLPEKEYSRDTSFTFFQQLEDRVAELPGMQAVSVSGSIPLTKNSSMTVLKIEGKPMPEDFAASLVSYHTVGPKYFDALRIPLLKGRSFTEQDRSGAKRVAIINQTAAQRFFPNEEPIGQHLFLEVGWKPEGDQAEIVGIARDVKYGNVDEVVGPDIYLCYLQYSEASVLIARTAGDPAGMATSIRQTVLSLDPNVPVYDVKTMNQRVGDSTARTRFISLLLWVFAGIALILSAIGVYGVMAYSVSERTREIGIRLALGAQQSKILRMVIGDGMILAGVGVIGGIFLALVLNNALTSFLYEVTGKEPRIFLAAALLLIIVTLVATFVPARKAIKVDPIVALKYE